MLFILFQIGSERYALDAGQVVAVLPRLGVKAIPLAPSTVAGLCDYRGVPVPVIDLSELALGRPSANRLSTRIVLVTFPGPAAGPHLLGLLVERATQTLRREPAEFVAAGVNVDAAPWLGPVTTDAQGLIQRVEVQGLLPASLRAMLFDEAGAA
ncbi:chemotaxis protein CheW [Pelomonas sp. Root1237]|uniref:chemotaxis protein CheW n=1 Tax=Pelomonas sp. Root1237 TaxID=1736434 RepID=UPI0006FA5F07|nr:chemotaxis protein CheW [Pelomonas sp. Root1237]KQV89507.1 chemotaxis protein CheW [Pelomonas sp. Root1237]